MIINTGLTVHNKFEATLIDSRTNEVKQEATAYNEVLQSFWERGTQPDRPYFKQIYISKTALTDTSIPVSPEASDEEGTVISTSFNYPVSTKVVRAVFPATSSITGDYVEVGFVDYRYTTSRRAATKAAFKDSEGNNIIINKLDTDILIITATVYITLSYQDFINPVKPEINSVLKALISNTGRGWATVGASYGNDYFIQPMLNSSTNIINTKAYNGSQPNTDFLISTVPYSFKSTTKTMSTTAPFRVLNTVTAKDQPICFVNQIYLIGLGTISLPNEDIFPSYRTVNFSVGTGDGVKTDFVCPIPTFTPGTEIIKINGVTKVRDVDYTVDSAGNSALIASASVCGTEKVYASFSTATSYYNANTVPLIPGNVQAYSDLYIVFDHLNPVTYKFENEVAVNSLYIPGITCYNTTSALSLQLQASYDGDEFFTICETSSRTIPNTIVTFDKTLYTFEEVTAKYFKLISTGSSYYGLRLSQASFFGKVGEGIKFTTPPPADASIVISAEVDRPLKTPDYLFDIHVTKQF